VTDFERHSALFLERAAKVTLEEPITPLALFGLFEDSFSQLPGFVQTMDRFYETHPKRKDHTVPNLITFIIPAMPFIRKLSSPSHAAFGLLGHPINPIAAAGVSPSPLPSSLENGCKESEAGGQQDQQSALLAYLAEQGIAVPPHLVAGALTVPPAPQSSSSHTGPRTSLTAPSASAMAGLPAMVGSKDSGN
jgi:hypothetical protein